MMRQVANVLMGLQRPERLRHLAALRPLERLAPDALAARSQDALTRILRHAASHVPHYRDFCTEAGLDPATVEARHLDRFPRVDKEVLRTGGARFHAENLDPRRFVASHTGGSSGVAFRFYVDADAVELRAANDLRARTWTGWRPGDRQALLWGHAEDNRLGRSLRHRLSLRFIQRVRMLNAYDMDDEDLDAYYHDLCRYRPRLLLGYASALAFFATYVKRRGLPFPAPLGIISSAETLRQEYRTAIEGAFPCPVLDRYGSRELAVVAQECPESRRMHAFSDRVHLEILRPDGTSCAPGERGEIVATDLDNLAMPFIRYRTGDIAAYEIGTCACGRGYPLLSGVQGRASEILVGADGRYVWGSPLQFRGDIPGIRRMQLVQERLGAVTVRIEPDTGWNDDVRARLADHVADVMGGAAVTIEVVESIPPAASGKYRFAISNVSPFAD